MVTIDFITHYLEKQLAREDLVKSINRGARSLWTQVGGTLDHVLLWWSNAPVASQPPSHAKYLRDWLLVLQPDGEKSYSLGEKKYCIATHAPGKSSIKSCSFLSDAPEPILSTLKRLGESLTMHVTTTTWDRQFSAAIVTATTLPIDISVENCPYKPDNLESATAQAVTKTNNNNRRRSLDYRNGTTCGLLWREALKTLVKLCNSCDGGTIPIELPIVEQIPILHRLDHTIHSMRLWAAQQSKSLCTEWNMGMFFKIVHSDIGASLEQLTDLRVPQMVQPGPIEVHVQVCVALRAKLVSEIKINIEKLKLQANECIEVLSSICMTLSLATLTLCFPPARTWQCEEVQSLSNDYVKYFLGKSNCFE